MKELMLTLTGLLMYAGLAAGSVAAWITGVVADGSAERWGWMAVDIVLPFIGVIRGVMEWL